MDCFNPRQLSDCGFNQRSDYGFDRRGQLRTPVGGGRLYAQQDHGRLLPCEYSQRHQQIGNAQLVRTSVARQGLQLLARHPNQRSRRLPDVDCVQHEQVGAVPDVGEQLYAQRTTLNQA